MHFTSTEEDHYPGVPHYTSSNWQKQNTWKPFRFELYFDVTSLNNNYFLLFVTAHSFRVQLCIYDRYMNLGHWNTPQNQANHSNCKGVPIQSTSPYSHEVVGTRIISQVVSFVKQKLMKRKQQRQQSPFFSPDMFMIFHLRSRAS